MQGQVEEDKSQQRVIELDSQLSPPNLDELRKWGMKKLKTMLPNAQYDKINIQASYPSLQEELLGHQSQSGFIQAIQLSYAKHIPLDLSPDNIWLLICQGFCSHVLKNSEELRKHFVDFQGKKRLVVRCNDFKFGSPDNNWGYYFTETSNKIRQHIGESAYSVLVPDFSTTTRIQKLLYQATLMASMQKYFDYVCKTMCGIPKIRLRGTGQDWKNLRAKTSELAKYELDWWISKILPIIDKMVSAAVDGEKDSHFWNSIYKVVGRGGSGQVSRVNGWITNFFPYYGQKKNTNLRDLDEVLDTMKIFEIDNVLDRHFQGEGKYSKQELLKISQARKSFQKFPPAASLPNGRTQTPFTWEYYSQEYEMKLISGFFGAELTDDGYIMPKVGWAVGDVKDDAVKTKGGSKKTMMAKKKQK